MTNEEAVQRDLDRLGDEALKTGGLAHAALTLARGLDSDSSLTSKGQAAKALQDILNELRALAPEETKEDGVDELQAKRKARKGEARAAS